MAATGPGGSSPGTARATSCSGRCSTRASRARRRSERRDDGLVLTGVRVAAVVRCAPPANKPTIDERDRCMGYLERELAALSDVRVIVALGAYAWDGALRALARLDEAIPRPRPTFGHGAEARVGRYVLLGSYHPSQQNTFTGRLTPSMLGEVVRRARRSPGSLTRRAPGRGVIVPAARGNPQLVDAVSHVLRVVCRRLAPVQRAETAVLRRCSLEPPVFAAPLRRGDRRSGPRLDGSRGRRGSVTGPSRSARQWHVQISGSSNDYGHRTRRRWSPTRCRGSAAGDEPNQRVHGTPTIYGLDMTPDEEGGPVTQDDRRARRPGTGHRRQGRPRVRGRIVEPRLGLSRHPGRCHAVDTTRRPTGNEHAPVRQRCHHRAGQFGTCGVVSATAVGSPTTIHVLPISCHLRVLALYRNDLVTSPTCFHQPVWPIKTAPPSLSAMSEPGSAVDGAPPGPGSRPSPPASELLPGRSRAGAQRD